MSSSIRRHLKQQRPFASLEEEVFVGLQVVADRLMAPWAEHLRKHAGLTPAQYNVLRILRGAGAAGLWAGEISERLVARSPDVTRLVDRLERQGLVARAGDPRDRRAVRVHITEAGRERIRELDEPARAMLRQHVGDLGPERLRELRDALGALLERVEGR